MKYSNDFLFRCYGAYWFTPLFIPSSGKMSKYRVGDFEMHDAVHPYYQLALTPLSAISDEDAIEVAKILRSNPIYHTAHYGRRMAEILSDFRSTDGEDFHLTSVLHAFDFLRSNKRSDGSEKPVYDCGFGEVPSLIDAGIAINRQTLKP